MSETYPGKGRVITKYNQNPEALPTGLRKKLSPIAGIRKMAARRQELQEADISRLTEEVARKLLEGISEKGMVSLFHDKETGELITELYSAYFSSDEVESIHVWAARERIQKPSTFNKIWLQIQEHLPAGQTGYRVLHIEQGWDMEDGEYKPRFTRDVFKGNPNSHLSNSEKIEFLKQLLASDVDEAQTERKFGAPYSPGGTRSSSTRLDDTSVHNAYWVRDISHQLEPLSSPRFAELEQ